MPDLPDAAVENYTDQQQIIIATQLLTRRLWDRLMLPDVDFDVAWRQLGPQLEMLVTIGQQAAVEQSSFYVPAVLSELNIAAEAEAQLVLENLIGIASDGRDLNSLLYRPIVETRTALGDGAVMDKALSNGRTLLDDIVQQQVADAGRAGETIETAVRPRVGGYVRMLNLPSCSRCVVLAGKFYRWNTGFLRHPRCDCRHIPSSENVAGDLTTDPNLAVKEGLVHGLSRAEEKAILEDGADVGKVVNSRRGMYTEGGVKLTREGTKTRGTPRNQARPRPEAIYQAAGNDRAKAIALLERYGYIVR